MAGLFGAPEESEAVRSLCNSGTLAAPALAAEVGWNRLPRPHARPFPSRREVLARRQSQADGAGRFDRFWRKIRLISFAENFEGHEDRELEAALREEYPGILAWAVRGCLRYRERGLEPPKMIRAATAAYRQESDRLGAFLAACTVSDNNS